VILVGDIGGTKTVLALVEDDLTFRDLRTFRSRDYRGLEQIVHEFVPQGIPIARASFGVAGPVREGAIRTTNLAWIVDAGRLARVAGIPDVLLINDLEAIAYGVRALDDTDFVELNPNALMTEGNMAVIAAGTGLGEAGLYWDGHRHRPFATEGGHSGFAPRDELEVELLRFLLAEHGHVSWERVLSGPGLFNIYRFLRDSGRFHEPTWLADRIRDDDPAVVISRCAMQHGSPLCEQALDLFVSLYGAEAGNLALKTMAVGGVYVAGGIAPKILERLKGGAFHDAFVAKGRMRSLLEGISVRVVVSDRAALIGAACATMRPA
jgi:glucokinase